MGACKAHLHVGVGPYEKLAPEKDGRAANEVLRRRELNRGGKRAVTRIFVRGDVLQK
jgi:hypothetical protein